MDYTALSKEVSYALRHAPWEYELELDEEGFTSVEQLLLALNESGTCGGNITRKNLEHMIECSEKRRHEIVGDSIRALYGHSIPGRLLKETAVPPSVLYHGTMHAAANLIASEGLKPMGRQYVHLSVNLETATRVGQRRDSNPVLFEVDALAAYHSGIPFYVGNENVWLADSVPAQFLAKI